MDIEELHQKKEELKQKISQNNITKRILKDNKEHIQLLVERIKKTKTENDIDKINLDMEFLQQHDYYISKNELQILKEEKEIEELEKEIIFDRQEEMKKLILKYDL